MRKRRLVYSFQFRGPYGVIDFAFPSARLAVYVDGAFWHGTSWRARGFRSLKHQFSRWRNGAWWLEKVRTNRARDRRQSAALRRAGWSVLRISDLAVLRDADSCAQRVERALNRRMVA
jgi:DNA mismatch endonuclease (patch repair protein)